MFLEKQFYRFAFVPACPINIQPDGIALKPFTNMPQTFKKFFSVAFRCPQQTTFTDQRGNPAENIQSLTMVTGCGNAQPFTYFSPTHAQTRMGSKTRLIFKYYRFTGFQSQKFFLTGIRTVCPHCPWLEDTNSPLALTEIQYDASSIVPALLLSIG